MDERTPRTRLRDDRLAREHALLAYLTAHPISGASDDDAPVVPDLPDVSTLTDDELAQALAERLELVERLHAGDAEVVGELTTDELIDAMTRAVEQVEELRGAITERETAAADAQARMDELATRARGADDATGETAEGEDEGGEGGEGDGEGEQGDGEGAGQAEAVAASARQAPPAARQLPARRLPARSLAARAPKRQDAAEPGVRLAVTAAADVPGYATGAALSAEDDLVRALMQKRRVLGGGSGSYDDRVPVATIAASYPAERQLDNQSPEGNQQKVDAVVGRQALVAAGGLCAPVTPLYDLPVFGVAARPTRDMLPSFQATRGGIIYMTPPDVSEITTAIGMITAAQDAAGGAPATKTCQEVTCPPVHEVDVNIVYRCLKFRNLTSRTHPELVANFIERSLIAYAQLAEVRLLDAMKASSTLVSAASPTDGGAGAAARVLGAAGTFFGHLAALAAATRNRLRMDPEARLRFLGPAWLLDALQVDGLRRAFHQEGVPDDASFLAAFRALGIEPSFYLDGPTGDAQMWAPQAAGAMLPFPPTASWFLFPEGTFLHLDGGELDLGLVRDSALNSQNAYQLFTEAFENVAKIGPVSYNVVSALCPNGTTGGSVALACPAT